MENIRFPCRDTNASRRVLSHIRPSQDHQFSPFLASVAKAYCKKKKKALLNPLCFPGWFLSAPTSLWLWRPLSHHPPPAAVGSDQKQCLQKWKERDATEWTRIPRGPSRWELRLGHPAWGLQRQRWLWSRPPPPPPS